MDPVEEQPAECMRKKSTVLSLIPFRTSSLFGEGLLASVLSENDAFQKFTSALDKMDNDLADPLKRWSAGYRLHGSGTFQLYDLIIGTPNREFSSLVPQTAMAILTQESSQKLPRPAAELLGRSDGEVLQHKKRLSWGNLLVNSKIWDHLADLPALLSSFQLQVKSLSTLASSSATRTSPPAVSKKSGESLQDVAVKIVDDSVASLASSKASKILANFGIMALNMAFMRMGYLELPDSVTELENKLGAQFSNLSALLKKGRSAKGLRCPFYYSMFVTPFSLLVPVVLSKESISLEEMVTICKELGNQYPPVLDQLQRDILYEVFRQSCGLQNSLESALRLSEMWGRRDWGKELEDVAKYYKRPDNGPKSDGPLKLLEADVVGEVPDSWPLSDLARKHMHQQRQSMNCSQTVSAVPNPGSSSNNLDGDSLPHGNLSEGQQGSTSPAARTSIRSPSSNDAFLSLPMSPSVPSATAEQQQFPSPMTGTIGPDNPSPNTTVTTAERQSSLPPTTVPMSVDNLALDVDSPISPITSSPALSPVQQQSLSPAIVPLNLDLPLLPVGSPAVLPPTVPTSVDNLAFDVDSPISPITGSPALNPVQQQSLSPAIIPLSLDLPLLPQVGSPAVRSSSLRPPPLVFDDQSVLINPINPASEQAEEGASRYPKRNRQPATVTEELPQVKPEKLKRPPPKRRKLSHVSPEVVDVDSVMELLSHEDGRRELDERIRVKQEELEINIVDALPALRVDQPTPKYTDSLRNPYIAKFFDCDGKEYDWKAFFHNNSDFKAFRQFHEQLQADYVQDATNPESRMLPRFLTQPKTSIFHIVTRKEFNRLSVQEVQNLLLDHCIVITDEDRPEIQFDITGIEAVLGSIHKPTEIQDQSIRPQAGNFQHRITVGTPEHLYKASIADHASKKSLNALHFPNPNAGIEPSPFSSDARAFLQTAGEPYCLSLSMPIADLRWSLGATEGAHHYWHIDSDGLCTFIEVACGLKLWGVAREKSPDDFASIKFWAHPQLDVTETRKIYSTEAIVLNCRHTLLMGPARPHAVWTLEPSLCRGGHFIATSVIDKTVMGIVHGFFRGNIITNVEHEEIWNILQRQMIFYHVSMAKMHRSHQDDGHLPNLDTELGVRAIFRFFALIELQNVFCALTYREALPQDYPHLPVDRLLPINDMNAASKDHRWRRIYSRGAMHDLIIYISSQYEFLNKSNGECVDPYHDIFAPLVAWVVVASQHYHKLVYTDRSGPATGRDERVGFVPIKEIFEKQLEWVRGHPIVGAAICRLEAKKTVTASLWPEWNFEARPRSSAILHEVPHSRVLSLNGVRNGDRLYFSIFEPEPAAVSSLKPTT